MIGVQAPYTKSHISPTSAPLSEESRWYAIHTRARHERRVTAQLEEKGIAAFLPTVTEERRWSDRTKMIESALFSCYTFVRITSAGKTRLTILQTPGVLRFVGINNAGIAIPDQEIDSIKTLLTSDVACTPCPFLRAGTPIRIRGGSLDGVEGILVAQNSDRTLVVSIGLIQQAVSIRLDGYQVEAI